MNDHFLWREKRALMRRRLAYHRRRMPYVARCRQAGHSLAVRFIGNDGIRYRTHGWVRADHHPDWKPVLGCDLSSTKHTLYPVVPSKGYVEFDSIKVSRHP